MMKKKNLYLLSGLAVLLLLALVSSGTAQDLKPFKAHLQKANAHLMADRHFLASDELKKATQLKTEYPSVHMRLGILYYGLGLIPEAIAEGEKAVKLVPSSKWFRYDLGKFYLVNQQYDKAQEQFTTILAQDPGFTLGYYYLGEVFYYKNQYDLAWLCLQRAKLLGHKGQLMEDKLASKSSRPQEVFSSNKQSDTVYRFIVLPTRDEAETVVAKISGGKLFENLQLELQEAKANKIDFGLINLSELKPSIAQAVADMKPYAPPQIVKTGPEYRIMQRVIPFNLRSWATLLVAPKMVAQSSVAKKMSTKPAQPQQAAPKVTTAAVPATPPEPVATKAPVVAKAPVVSEKAPATVTQQAAPEGDLSAKLAVIYALESWADAWEAANVDQYLAMYSTRFRPEKNISLSTWKKKRRRSLTRPKTIDIEILSPYVEMIDDSTARITFKQNYRSNTYQDSVLKNLTLQREPDGWRITREVVAKVLSK